MTVFFLVCKQIIIKLNEASLVPSAKQLQLAADGCQKEPTLKAVVK